MKNGFCHIFILSFCMKLAIELPVELPIGLPIGLPIVLPIGLPIELPIVSLCHSGQTQPTQVFGSLQQWHRAAQQEGLLSLCG